MSKKTKTTIEKIELPEGIKDLKPVGPVCLFRACEDPDTGKIRMVPVKDSCPEGMVEKYIGRMATKGILISKEKISIEE